MHKIDAMRLLGTLLQDLRYGTRMLFRNKGFTVAAIVALALGIGLNTAVFTANKVLLGRRFDARDPGSLVNIAMVRQSGATDPFFSYPDYLAFRDQMHSFSGLIATSEQLDPLILSGAGGTESQRSAGSGSWFQDWGLLPSSGAHKTAELAGTFIVSENYFSVLGVAAPRGRLFGPGDEAELRKSPAAVISENFWQRRFGGDPAILGRAIRLNGVAFTIIGIAPHDFVGTSIAAPAFWLPISLQPLVHAGDRALIDRDDQCCRIFGRLAPGATLREAELEMNLLAGHLRALHDSRSDLSKPATVTMWPGSPFPNKFPPNLKLAVLLIMAAAGLVLVIACANVASLQLARAAARQSELGLRMSLGATRGRLIRQLLTESALLGLIAGALAFLCSWGLLAVMARFAKETLPLAFGTFVVKVRPDLDIFAYVFVVSIVAGVLFGLAPALESSRSALSAALKAHAALSPTRSRRLRDTLVGAQVAVSLVLLIGGAMLIRSSIYELKMDTGYDAGHAISISLRFPDAPDYSQERRSALVSTLQSRLAALPGVEAVTSGRAPDDDNIRLAAASLDGNKPTTRNTRAYLYYRYVEPNYFETMGIPLLFGSGFQRQASQPSTQAILSESAARKLWPGQNPIGRRLRLGTDGPNFQRPRNEPWSDGPDYEVIGVARETRGVLLDQSDSDQVYVSMPPGSAQAFPVLMRTRPDAAQMMSAIEPVIASIDPNIVAATSTVDGMLRQTTAFIVSSTSATIAIAIGAFALVLASMGIYGTVSYVVVLRTREVGIRMALGATKRQIAGLIVRESTRPVMIGLAIGLVLAVGDTFLLRGVLYGVGRFDAVSFAGVSLLLLAIAMIAAYVPSRRAMRVDPAVALRYE